MLRMSARQRTRRTTRHDTTHTYSQGLEEVAKGGFAAVAAEREHAIDASVHLRAQQSETIQNYTGFIS
jgi:hypothetical protein